MEGLYGGMSGRLSVHREAWLTLLQQQRLLAVIRAPTLQLGLAMARAAEAGGIRLIEITWNSDQPEALVSQLRAALPHCWVGVGTLLTPAEAEAAIAAGAQFGFSPYIDPQILELGCRHQIPMVAGALTPTEIARAWAAGAAAVKVFPISAVGGAAYLRSLRGPLPHIPLVPTGGVTLDNARSLLEAGAIAVGLAGALFPEGAVRSQDWTTIAQRIQTLVQAVQAELPQVKEG